MTAPTDSSTTRPLPRPLTRFIGREDEIESIVALIERDDVRLVTLTGTGGIGKTRLAIEVAHRLDERSDWNTSFVTLASVGSVADALPQIAGALGLWNSQPDDVVPRLTELLDDEQILLVIDNLEHIIDIARDIGELLAGTTGLTILATSRAPLHIQGEREYSVPQLTVPSSDEYLAANELLKCEAIALFIDRAAAVHHEFQPDESETRAIARICEQLDGLPLAIELAAARTRTLPPQALLSRLDNQLGLLRSEARDLPDRLRTIRATIDWSYRLLSPDEQRTFRQISIFDGDFPLSAAEFVLDIDDEALDIIESLVDKSLLLSREPQNAEPHFRMLSVVRQFGLEKLEASDEGRSVRLRQAEWTARLAEALFVRQFGTSQREVFQQIDRVHETIRQSLLWSMEEGDWDTAARIAANLWQYWDLFGYLGQGRNWLRRIVQQDRDWPVDLIPNLYYGFAILAGSAADADENQRLGEALLERYRESEDPRLKAIALNMLGLSRDPQLALESADRAAQIWRETGDTIWYGLAIGLAGRWAREVGDLERSESYSRQSFEILNQAGHIWGAALALLGIGRVHQLRGEIDQAVDIYRRGLTQLRELGDRILVLRYVEFMIDIATQRGHWAQAVRLAGASTRMRQTMGYELRYEAEEEANSKFQADARVQLGEEGFQDAWATGQRFTLEQTIAEAMTEVDSALPASEPASRSSSGLLTRREQDVLRLIIEGKTDQSIADELFVSYRTVTTHVTNILNKLGANSRTEAAAMAVREGLI